MTKYDLIIDVNFPDHAALMYPVKTGRWVKTKEAEEEIKFLKEALMNLKNCNMNLNTPADLNAYVNSVLEVCK